MYLITSPRVSEVDRTDDPLGAVSNSNQKWNAHIVSTQRVWILYLDISPAKGGRYQGRCRCKDSKRGPNIIRLWSSKYV